MVVSIPCWPQRPHRGSAICRGSAVLELTLGSIRFRIRAAATTGGWVATIVRLDNGDLAGPEMSGATEEEAVQKARRWLEWQHEHAQALDALQQAERAYHRVIAGSAFASG